MGSLNAARIQQAGRHRLGIVALALGSFSHVNHAKDALMVDIPVWAGVAGVMIGSALLIMCARKF